MNVVAFTMLIGFGLACVVGDSVAQAEGQPEVDLELILAVDVSRSIDGDEHRLQREGYVAAFRHPNLLRAIRSGPIGRIAVVYFEWARKRHQSVAVPWTIVGDAGDANAFADALASQPILPEAGTSISASLMFDERIFAVSGTRGLRRAIDISGDGANNDGPAVEPVRQRLMASGVTINGLPIDLALDGAGDVTDYYERHVVGGHQAEEPSASWIGSSISFAISTPLPISQESARTRAAFAIPATSSRSRKSGAASFPAPTGNSFTLLMELDHPLFNRI